MLTLRGVYRYAHFEMGFADMFTLRRGYYICSLWDGICRHVYIETRFLDRLTLRRGLQKCLYWWWVFRYSHLETGFSDTLTYLFHVFIFQEALQRFDEFYDLLRDLVSVTTERMHAIHLKHCNVGVHATVIWFHFTASFLILCKTLMFFY